MQHLLENIQMIIQNNHSPVFLAVFIGGWPVCVSGNTCEGDRQCSF